ncbi:MAG: amidohydrolase [bacterium]|nr:amidohydrolase [bacterium]
MSGGKLTVLERGRRGLPLDHIEVIDMHAHIRVRFGVQYDRTGPEDIVAGMDRAGVDITLVTTSAPVSQVDSQRENRAVLDAMAACPGRILGYLRPWPTREPPTVREAEARLSRYTGLKLYDYRDVTYLYDGYGPYLAAANERCMPVLFHTWGQDVQLDAIRTLAARYPDTSMLAGHSGSANEAAYVQLAHDAPNVYLDLTYSLSPRGLVRRLVDAVGAERVVWGSDVALFSQGQQLGKVLGADIPEADKVKILGGNARRILDRAASQWGVER